MDNDVFLSELFLKYAHFVITEPSIRWYVYFGIHKGEKQKFFGFDIEIYLYYAQKLSLFSDTNWISFDYNHL